LTTTTDEVPMQLTNAFEIDAPLQQTWQLLVDVPRVVPCMPGAELVEAVGDDRWRARLKVKLGPMAMTFDADVQREQQDDEARRVRLATRAREVRGRGDARATIESTATATADGGTRVEIVTDVALSGRVAQFGRGVIQDVANQLVERFTDGLRAQLAAGAEPAPAGGGAAAAAACAAATPGDAPAPAPAPALGLGRVLLATVRGSLRRLAVRLRLRST
ncbi:MAG TPA: SRPBCC family protein, partial [Conexibacter sp.]|nr:SRPBCC family protein [Conexibacter sp.]